ncbi:GNAT family N-acetyltransferase [Nocardia tengchongensis]|uniref:GNAT family N-acetyltransferase n=1 Tax=Nocardia tengchongensis TaxID=2055889 RepID=UPI00369472B8
MVASRHAERARLPLIREATTDDIAGIVHAMIEGARAAYARLPESASWLPKVLAGMVLRWPELYEERLNEIARGLSTRKIFVAWADDRRIVGAIDAAVRSDGAGQLYAWHVLPEFHGGKTSDAGPTVGQALMNRALEYLGATTVYSNTTVGTVGLRAHLKHGFEIDSTVAENDPRLAMPATWAAAGCPATVTLPDGTFTSVGRQVILVRRPDLAPSRS